MTTIAQHSHCNIEKKIQNLSGWKKKATIQIEMAQWQPPQRHWKVAETSENQNIIAKVNIKIAAHTNGQTKMVKSHPRTHRKKSATQRNMVDDCRFNRKMANGDTMTHTHTHELNFSAKKTDNNKCQPAKTVGIATDKQKTMKYASKTTNNHECTGGGGGGHCAPKTGSTCFWRNTLQNKSELCPILYQKCFSFPLWTQFVVEGVGPKWQQELQSCQVAPGNANTGPPDPPKAWSLGRLAAPRCDNH